MPRHTTPCELTDALTGEIRTFSTTVSAEKFMGHNPGYIRRRILNGEKIMGHDGHEYYARYLNKVCATIEHKPRAPEQLCWKCKKAGGRCRWSRNSQPIKGWTAIETTVKSQNINIPTYIITECPEFVEG